jgi:phosphotriesterase-related protein
MTQVQTLDGAVDVERLGVTLMHEHVLLVNREIATNYPGYFDEEAEVAAAQRKLAELRAQGVETMVDLTALGLGRDVELVRRCVEGSGINLVVATGFYGFDELPFFFKTRGPGSFHGGPEILEELFERDINEGIAHTGVKAGILKCVTDVKGITPDIDRVLRAVARVHRRTGLPISTHTHAATYRGRDQQRLFLEEGVDLSRVVIGHCGDSTDIAYLVELMEAGSYIGMDRFGLDIFLPTPERIDTVVELARLGYTSKMVLSHDTTCFSMSFETAARAQKLPDWQYTFLMDRAVPMMRERGVTEEQIRQMLVDNPRAIFSRMGRY